MSLDIDIGHQPPDIGAVKVGDRVPNRDPIFADVTQFLTDEAALLDDNDLEAWFHLLADDIVYTAPVRRTVMRRQGSGFDETMSHFDDDADSLAFRVRRFLDSENAFADDPPSRVRRHVSNITVWTTDQADEYLVRSNLLALRSRWDAPTFDILSCRRDDVLRLSGPPRLAQRTIYFDQATLGTPNLAIFL